jgi:hypothetical protein
MGAEAHHLLFPLPFDFAGSGGWSVLRLLDARTANIRADRAIDRHGAQNLCMNSSTRAVNDFLAPWCKLLRQNNFRKVARLVRFYRNIYTPSE